MSLSRWLIIVGMAGLPTVAVGQVTDYSAGKSPAQLFATDCAACHQSARGLAKGRDQRSLSGFLREHYTTKQETAATLAAFLAGAPAGPASETRNPGAPGGRQQSNQAGRTPRPPNAINEPEDGAIAAPEPGTHPQRTRPTREAAKPPARGKKPDAAAEEAEKEAQRTKVRGYATVGDEARPKVSAPAAVSPAPAAAPPAPATSPPPASGDTSARSPASDTAPTAKPSEPARSDSPAAPTPSGEERRAPPG